MKTFKSLTQPTAPHDYQPALQGALSWLGKRYLLAEPLNRRAEPFTGDDSTRKSLPPLPMNTARVG
jgi:hypothetical protein